jgi:thiol:disulfide interchange protein
MPLNFSVTAMTMLIAMTLALAPFAATSIQAKPTGATSKKSSAAKEIVWEAAERSDSKGKASGKPIMLDFYTTGGWCNA